MEEFSFAEGVTLDIASPAGANWARWRQTSVLNTSSANEDVRENILTGPMGPYLPALAARLLETGYSKGQARRLLLSADGLARWLQRNGTTLTDQGGSICE